MNSTRVGYCSYSVTIHRTRFPPLHRLILYLKKNIRRIICNMKSISGRRLGFPIQFRPVLTDIPSINNHHYRNALCLLSVQICHLAKVFRNPWKIAREINQKNGDGERSTSLSRYRQKPKACVKRVKGDQSGEKHSNR
uniref:Uncharacterized protein n=1 Tax=Lactuca sativa TaxID=4236 RepID=A0A9R1VAW1_LACSA|nr:hypothetical protein LSAT_V11C600315870 [Lactuca sativa]